MKRINYNMTSNYCSDWTAPNALREIVQNAIDSSKPYSAEIRDDGVHVITKGVTLKPEAFALGYSEKSGSPIGGYGEGFKIGMLILTRLGLKPTLACDGFIAHGKFIIDEFTGLDTFCIDIEEDDVERNHVYFKCDLTGLCLPTIKEQVTQFSEKPLPKVDDNIQILQGIEYAGKLYVNGLYICTNKDLTHGYNFSPNRVKLNRDRNMVDGVIWQLGQFYATQKAEIIFKLMLANARDVEDVQYFLTDKTKLAELARLFYNKYGEGATISKPYTSYVGSSSGVSVSRGAGAVFSRAGICETKKTIDPNMPAEVLKTFVERNKKKLRRDVRNQLETITNKAKSWSK